MIRIDQIKCVPEKVTRDDGSMDTELLRHKAAKVMGIAPQRIERLDIRRRSIDARKKPQIFYIFSVDVTLHGITDEQFMMRSPHGCEISPYAEYVFPEAGTEKLSERPLIVGMGPAGLFCAYELALHGYRPLVIERGKSVEQRKEDVERFFREGTLLPDSNVQFGEGGAGAFSDGKLNTLIRDQDGRGGEVLRILCGHGAKEEIRYDAKPHLGTDALGEIVKRIREDIRSLGGEILFETKLDGYEEVNGQITCAQVTRTGGERCSIPCGALVLAIGHSARDTLEMLYEKRIDMEAKAFAVGLRTEHPQTFINESQYGRADTGVLGAAAYKLTARAGSGRGVYTFCMCPGGYVVNASSEEGMLAVNGMSYARRDGENANSAVIVTVSPQDYGDGHPLSGIAFQRDLERKAYALAGGKVPVERYGQFKAEVCGNDPDKALPDAGGMQAAHLPEEHADVDRNGMTDQGAERFSPCIKGQYAYANVSEILPAELARDLVEGMEAFDRKIPGFAADDVLVEGVESRTSSPVRILRGEEMTSPSVKNLYPCGEGAGYAGGIMSAAMDGIRIAEAVAARYAKP